MKLVKLLFTHIICFAASLILIFPTEARAQNAVKRLSNVDGLSNNSINCIFEDSQQTIWIGTWDGLNAYNGRDFRTYRYNRNNEQSISNNIIRQIVEQDPTCIWVATDYGVNRWNRNNQTFSRFFLGTEHQIPKQEKSFLLGISAQKRVICYVKEQGLFFFDETQQKFERVKNYLYQASLKKFIIDKDDNIYLLFDDGRLQHHKLNYSDGQVELVNPKYIEQQHLVSNIFLSDDKLIVNYGDYLKIIDSRNTYPSSIDVDNEKTISEIIFYNDHLFISFFEGGCVQYDLKTKQYAPIDSNIPDRTSIFSMYIGSQNILWIGTDGQGLLQIYEHSSPFGTISTNHPVRSFCQNSNGQILVGTKGDGIKLFQPSTQQLTDYLNINNGLISNSVYTIKKNKSGDIFIGTEGAGINVISAKTNRIEKLNIPSRYPQFRAVYSIYFTNNDRTLWLGTSGYGLIKITLQKDDNSYIVTDMVQYTSSNDQNSISNNVIYSIISSNKPNELWLGTRGGGVNRFNLDTEKFERLDDIIHNQSLTNNDVLSLSITENDLWIGTSYGLNKLYQTDNQKHIVEFTDDNGLANNTIHGILEDSEKNIWISTNKGISHLNLAKQSIENYSVKDGLQNDEFSDGAYYRSDDNVLYFGGVSGFNYFNPTKIHLREFEPTLTLSALRIYNTYQNINDRIVDGTLKLSYDEPYVTFTFIANDFINNENCEYDYRLINFSDEWIKNGNNPNIVLTKLPPGKYQLEVKSTNGDRIWGNNVYRLQIDVAFPWWLSTIAFLIYTALALIIGYVAISIIRNRMRLNRQLLLEHIEKQNQQKIYESRLNFFTNVAHEFFTPLTLIYGPAQHLLEQVQLDSYTKRYILIIKNNADRMQKLINELMEFRKLESGHTPLHPESIDISTLIDYVSDNYTEISQENKIDFRVDKNNISNIVSDRNSLEKIIFNLISNAFKYTPVGGYIRLDVSQSEENGELTLSVNNSGKGLTDRQMQEIFNRFRIFSTPQMQNSTSTGVGLNLTKSLVELLGGNITVDSKIDQYVEFKLNIPPLEQEAKLIATNEQEETSNTNNDIKLIDKKDVSILIVEDEKNIRELLKDILSPYYEITEAKNGEDALLQIEQNEPDIVISDVLMPKLDGIELIKRLKSSPKTAHIPIISISAKNTVEDHINAYEHGADLYITKPFHPQHILSTIKNLMSKHSMLKEYFGSSRSAVVVKDGISIHQEDEKLLQDIISFIEKNMDDESLNPNSISDYLGISKATLYRKLKDLTDKTPSEFVRLIRIEYASKLLITTKLTVSEIMFKSGFSNKSYFYRVFAKQFNLSPKDYRQSMTDNEETTN